MSHQIHAITDIAVMQYKFEPIIRSAVIMFWARCDISFPFGKKVGSECEDLGSNLRRCSMLLPLFHFHFNICKWSNYVQNEERRQMNLKISSLKLLLQNSFMAVSSQLGVRVSSCCASFQTLDDPNNMIGPGSLLCQFCQLWIFDKIPPTIFLRLIFVKFQRGSTDIFLSKFEIWQKSRPL